MPWLVYVKDETEIVKDDTQKGWIIEGRPITNKIDDVKEEICQEDIKRK